MKEWPVPAQDHRDIMKNPQKKAAYSSPVLRLYGSVRKLTMGTATVGKDGTNSRKNNQSDRATKVNIVRIDTHPLGIGLYLFDYKPEFRDEWGHGRQFGVMADEVEAVMPNAVSVHTNGYMKVDYAKLGISCRIH